MPSTETITEMLLSQKNPIRCTDGKYYPENSKISPGAVLEGYGQRVLVFLHKIKTEISRYYANTRPTNYEDLYYIAKQIHDSEVREYDNPVVQAFIDKIMPEITSVLSNKQDEWRLSRLADEAMLYIEWELWRLLSKKPSHLENLCCIKDACQDNQVSTVDIFTLNHDTVLESYLLQNNIEFVDGFGTLDNEVRYWNEILFENLSSKVRFFKLHGSVNWFKFTSDDGKNESVTCINHWDIWHTRNPAGYLQTPSPSRPMILAGTFNKMMAYTHDIYADLYCRFQQSLHQTSRLLMIGYGFADKGINSQFLEWLFSSENRAVIVNPKPEHHARHAIIKNWEELVNHRKIILIPKVIEATSWQEIKEFLFE
jgi:hypothetical protein